MKPAAYVADVVKAYRTILDAESGAGEKEALIFAKELLAQAPSRRLTSGHFEEAGKILAPHRSGVSGAWSATVKSVLGGRVLVDLRSQIAKGDRLRPESTAGKEVDAFSVSDIFDGSGDNVLFAQAGARVYLACSKALRPGDRLFKVGRKSEPAAAIWKKIRQQVPAAIGFKHKFSQRQKILDDLQRPTDVNTKQHETLILKLGSPDDLVQALRSSAAMVLLSATKSNLERIAKQRFSPPN